MHSRLRHLVFLNILAAAGLLLTACGGGGGGGGDTTASIDVPTAPLTITDANADAVTASVLDVQDIMVSLIESPDLVSGLTADGGTAAGALDFDLKSFSEGVVERIRNADLVPAPMVAAGVVVSGSEDCDDTGSVGIVWNDADDNGELSSGDSLSVDFRRCSDDGISFIDGEMSIVLTAFVVDPATSEAVTLDWTFSASAFTVTDSDETILLDGGYRLALSYDPVLQLGDFIFSGSRLAGSYTSPTEAEAFALTNFNVSYSEDDVNGTYVYDADYTVASTDIGGVITVTTDPSFQGTLDFSTVPAEPNYPITGVVLVEGDAGTTLQLDADTGDPATAELVITTTDTVITRIVNWTDIDDSI